jgi:hypothetical protein
VINDIPESPRDSEVLIRALVERIDLLVCPPVDPCPCPETGWTAEEWTAAAGLGQAPHPAIRGRHVTTLGLGAHDAAVISAEVCQRLARRNRLERASAGRPIRYRSVRQPRGIRWR